MNEATRQTKTERRILRTLYRLRTHGDVDCFKLGTYETLMNETLCSRPALLSTCQRLVKEGKIIRRKVNALDRKQWERLWPVGFARRQAHFSLSPAMLQVLEADDDMQEWLDEEHRRQVAGRHVEHRLEVPHGGYSIGDEELPDSRTLCGKTLRPTWEVAEIKSDATIHQWTSKDRPGQSAVRRVEPKFAESSDDGYRPAVHEDWFDPISDFDDLPC